MSKKIFVSEESTARLEIFDKLRTLRQQILEKKQMVKDLNIELDHLYSLNDILQEQLNHTK